MSMRINFEVSAKQQAPMMEEKLRHMIERIMPEEAVERIVYFEQVLLFTPQKKTFHTAVITDLELFLLPTKPREKDRPGFVLPFAKMLDIARSGAAAPWLRQDVAVRSQNVVIRFRATQQTAFQKKVCNTTAEDGVLELQFYTFIERTFFYYNLRQLWLAGAMRVLRGHGAPGRHVFRQGEILEQIELFKLSLVSSDVGLDVRKDALDCFSEALHRDCAVSESFWNTECFCFVMDKLRETLPLWSTPAKDYDCDVVEYGVLLLELVGDLLTHDACSKARLNVLKFAQLHSFRVLVGIVLRDFEDALLESTSPTTSFSIEDISVLSAAAGRRHSNVAANVSFPSLASIDRPSHTSPLSAPGGAASTSFDADALFLDRSFQSTGAAPDASPSSPQADAAASAALELDQLTEGASTDAIELYHLLHQLTVTLLVALEDICSQAHMYGMPFNPHMLFESVRKKPSFFAEHFPRLISYILALVRENNSANRSVALYEHLHLLIVFLRASAQSRDYLMRNFESDVRYLLQGQHAMRTLDRSAVIDNKCAAYLHELGERCSLKPLSPSSNASPSFARMFSRPRA